MKNRRLADLANKLFNVKPNEEIFTMLKGEIIMPSTAHLKISRVLD